MTDAQPTFREFRNLLSIYSVNARAETFTALRDLLRGKSGQVLFREVGCDSDCPLCRWGKAEAGPWENHCRLWTFAEMLEDCYPGPGRGNTAPQKEAANLLKFIEKQDAPF